MFFICWVFPFFVMYSVYFGFISAMNINFFNYSQCKELSTSGVFQYRINPRVMLNFTYEMISTHNLPALAPAALYEL